MIRTLILKSLGFYAVMRYNIEGVRNDVLAVLSGVSIVLLSFGALPLVVG